MRNEIFIPDAPEPAADAAYLAEEQAAALAAVAAWGEWLATQSETVQALAAEWSTSRGSRFILSERKDKLGRTVYVCACEHGHHESLQSHEHALYLLVDSHRVRAEDRPETRARLEALGVAAKDALQACQTIGRDVASTFGRMPVADHNALVEAEVAALETKHAEEEAARPPRVIQVEP